ncbi:MAG TPA: DUF3383 domain-containing protein [Candidatus Aphodousia gallistercoris]|nr:DUF3383 domain-containing protein [Candidatus Aphodousia gallistercoris]
MTLPTLPVNRVVNVQIQMSPMAAQLRNFGAMLIIGSSDVIDAQERIRTYASATEVAADFGTAAPEYQAAVAFFSQSPQPTNVQIGRWIKEASNGLYRGKILSTSNQEMDNFTGIASGAFDLKIDGETVNVTGVNLSAQSNLNGVASQITTALNSKGTCLWNGQQFVIKSVTTGTSSTVSEVSDTELSQAMGLIGGTMVSGAQAESMLDATNALLDINTWYGAFYSGEFEQDDAIECAQAISASTPSHICAFTSMDTNELDSTQTSSLGYELSQLGNNRAFVQYSSTAPNAAMSVLGRMSTVNFEGSNTTITLKFKQCPGVEPEYLRTQQANALQGNNVNVFAAYQNDTSILQEGTMAGGWFIDETHGLDWLQNRVETDLWNLLYTSNTKIGQDESGVTAILSTINGSLDAAVRNGLVAPGVWNGDEFGTLKKGDTLSTGYYVYIQPLDEQSQSDREARKAPPIQVAVKLKGAIHSIDVTVTVNR